MKNALIGGFALLIASGCGFASASAMSLSSHPANATPIELVGWGDNGQGGGYGGTQQNSGGGYGGQQSDGQQSGGWNQNSNQHTRQLWRPVPGWLSEQQPAGWISKR